MEAEIERALDPGRFVSDRGCFRFVDSLERVAATVGQLVADDPERAVTLYETSLAGCYKKADEHALLLGWHGGLRGKQALRRGIKLRRGLAGDRSHPFQFPLRLVQGLLGLPEVRAVAAGRGGQLSGA